MQLYPPKDGSTYAGEKTRVEFPNSIRGPLGN